MSSNSSYKPSASGNRDMSNVNIADRHQTGGEEVTRRIAFQPSFEPVNFEAPPMVSKASPIFSNSSSQSTTVSKIAVTPVESVEASIWMLGEVPVLPEFHSLERTAVFVPNMASTPAVVATRISRALRECSIEAKYGGMGGASKNGKNNSSRVACITPEGVEFRIRLYRGRAPSYEHGVIVEIQRRFGTSYNWNDQVRAILNAAVSSLEPSKPSSLIDDEEFDCVPPPPALVSANRANLPLVVPSDGDTSYSGTEDSDDGVYTNKEISGVASIAMVSQMLTIAAPDSQALGLQTLVSLTDAARMGSPTATGVSRELWFPSTSNGTMSQAVQSKVLSYLEEKMKKPTETKKQSSLENDDEEEEEEMFHLRAMAFTVIANSISALGGDIPSDLIRDVSKTIQRALFNAESSPRVAFQAARILENIIPLIEDPATFLDSLETARKIGVNSHADLERQVKVCISRLHDTLSR